jgi:hypothetical protein
VLILCPPILGVGLGVSGSCKGGVDVKPVPGHVNRTSTARLCKASFIDTSHPHISSPLFRPRLSYTEVC